MTTQEIEKKEKGISFFEEFELSFKSNKNDILPLLVNLQNFLFKFDFTVFTVGYYNQYEQCWDFRQTG